MKRDLHIHSGEDFSKRFQLNDYVDGNSTLNMHIKKHPTDQEPLISLSPEIEEDLYIKIDIPNPYTKDIDPGQYVYDIRMESPEGHVSYPAWGTILIRAAVTTV